jgi:hypothetical protein
LRLFASIIRSIWIIPSVKFVTGLFFLPSRTTSEIKPNARENTISPVVIIQMKKMRSLSVDAILSPEPTDVVMLMTQ